ncbi:antibiotic biosynthesis monooxygenase [Leisingera sp. ANG-M1]|uniref:antibiotic biosynthesis monooxygenase family protein n=1 Tax=Leisingera sp. ANG-M1 TaxID=1577895 RepID=UPI0005801AC4|nr:antibiotic biosynthesis monooxygenase family protein [Leisingera sp. ANG-M1]KIC07936.1 antibiotic biosynthesis monooxygenase [Leisingera sp. ANG-M1]
MIIRVFRATVREDKIQDFKAFLTGSAVPHVRRQPGLISVTAGLPRPDSPATFCVVMVWESVEALQAFAGEDWEQPHVLPEEDPMVLSRQIDHYDMIGLLS